MIMNNNPVLLIGDSPISMSPYIRSYIEVFEKYNIPYVFIYWNKTMEDSTSYPPSFIPYNLLHNNKTAGWKKAFKIYKYTQFVKQQMKQQQYSYVVIFTIAHALFLHIFLSSRYKYNYVFDIRDYSPMCKLPFAQRIIKELIENSAFTVISSKGFVRWLPKVESNNILISHNTTRQAIEANYGILKPEKKNELRILTIGQIAYRDSQLCFLERLGNREGIILQFAGSGPAVPELKEYVKERGFYNVSFTGRYEKKDESEIVKTADMINIWLKNDINSETCMANRFYLSALFRKPMIVQRGSYMAELCEEYGLGVVIDETDDFSARILAWYANYNYELFTSNCQRFLKIVEQELSIFDSKLLELYRSTL